MMNGLSSINIELTSRCNKACFMCGRRQREKSGAPTDYGDMPLKLLRELAKQTPSGVMVQFHNNGEPLLYPKLEEALYLFRHCHTSFNTNGILLAVRAHEIINNVDSVVISVIPDDPLGLYQLWTAQEFLRQRGESAPLVIFRLLGEIDETREAIIKNELVDAHKCLITRRILHSPGGSFDYEKDVTIPEHGICLEMMHKLSIDRYGMVSPCVRFDPDGDHHVGVFPSMSLQECWENEIRQKWLSAHMRGKRADASPICAKCDYYGIPKG